MAEGGQAGEFERHRCLALAGGGEDGLDAGQHRADPIGRVRLRREPHEHERRRAVRREQLAGHERMVQGAAADGSAGGGIEIGVGVRDDRQQAARGPLTADVEDRSHLGHAVESREGGGNPPQLSERAFVEQIARSGRRADDAIPVRSPEPVAELVDQAKLGVVVTQQGPQIVVDPEPGDSDDGQRRQDCDKAAGDPSPAAGGSRCSSSGSTIQFRQFAAPQRQGMAASAGQQ